MIFLSENVLHEEVIEEVEGISLGMEPGLEAGLALEAMASNAFHNITEAVIIADAREFALRSKAALYEQTGREEEAEELKDKADELQEGVIKNMWEGIKDFFVRLWNWITGLFKDFFKWLGQWFQTSKGFAEKHGKAFEEAWGKLKSDWKYTGYKFDGVKDTVNKISVACKTAMGTTKDLWSSKDLSEEEVNRIVHKHGSENNDVDKAKFRANFVDNNTPEGDFASTLKRNLYGSDKPVELKKNDIGNAKDIVDNVKNEKGALDDLKAIKKDADKIYSECVKVVKGIADEFKKDPSKSGQAGSRIMNSHAKSLKYQCGIINTAISTTMGAYRAYIRQCKSVMASVISYRNPMKKTNESTNILEEIMSQLD